jgi:SAM-dependent methyltransferase
MRQRRLAFGEMAEVYDQVRPSYPRELVTDVLAYAGACAGDGALEVGAGTGKATVLFAERGLSVHAIEPSREMAAIARRNCSSYANVVIEETDFERWAPRAGDFRLVFSAQAWHWVEPEAKYGLARAVLADDGALAVFWNRPQWDRSPLREEMRAAYRSAAPEFGPRSLPGPMHPESAGSPKLWGAWDREIGAAVGFDRPEVRTYRWACEYGSDDYIRLLQTHSDHIVLQERTRSALLAAVRDVIDRHGGVLSVDYVTTLFLARAVHR